MDRKGFLEGLVLTEAVKDSYDSSPDSMCTTGPEGALPSKIDDREAYLDKLQALIKDFTGHHEQQLCIFSFITEVF